jgi:HEPN domain-containing protein
MLKPIKRRAALFLAHLRAEKLLKALFVQEFDEPPPLTDLA